MSLSAKILDYGVEGEVCRMSLECRYKEFKRVFVSGSIPKGDKLIHEIQRDALECCKGDILEWVSECDTQSVVGQFVPVPADFLTTPVLEQPLSSELSL